MIKTYILALGAAVTVAGCATTKREEVRNDQRNLEKQHREVASAMRDGSADQVRDEQADVVKAETKLSEHRSELYAPGREAAALHLGDRDTGALSALPAGMSGRYADDADTYYRSDGRMIYRIAKSDQTITGIYPITP
jgi:hypothetical protein